MLVVDGKFAYVSFCECDSSAKPTTKGACFVLLILLLYVCKILSSCCLWFPQEFLSHPQPKYLCKLQNKYSCVAYYVLYDLVFFSSIFHPQFLFIPINMHLAPPRYLSIFQNITNSPRWGITLEFCTPKYDFARVLVTMRPWNTLVIEHEKNCLSVGFSNDRPEHEAIWWSHRKLNFICMVLYAIYIWCSRYGPDYHLYRPRRYALIVIDLQCNIYIYIYILYTLLFSSTITWYIAYLSSYI